MTQARNFHKTTLDTVSRFDYHHDALGRRIAVDHGGSAFASQSFNQWGYNDRGELIASRRYDGAYSDTPSTTQTHSQRRLYSYDDIGNREDSAVGTGYQNGAEVNDDRFYCANRLNQYTYTDDASGGCPTPSTPVEAFTYDLDGNLTSDGQFTYAWDGENRLISVTPADTGKKQVLFRYDYMGRRVQKKIRVWDAGTSTWVDPAGAGLWDQRFVYDRWNVVLGLGRRKRCHVAKGVRMECHQDKALS